jgi:transcriptional regulator with XRE-family HTH domain
MGDTDEWLRQQVLRLVRQHGVSQKVLAAKMGLSTARLSRWLNKNDQHPVSVAALDGFQAYREHLRRDLSTDDIETDVTRQPKQGRAVPSAPRHQQHPRRRTG